LRLAYGWEVANKIPEREISLPSICGIELLAANINPNPSNLSQTQNNGITEGFHRKMKLIQRRAYGFRNFENYRIRVKVLCA
jgi:hypothetical protein